jgi:putative hydrolase of the HAD superfamily
MRYSPAPMLNISRIQAITLDLDDTLWPVWPAIERAEKKLQDWLATHAPATATLLQDGPTRRKIRAQVEAQWADLRHDVSVLRRESIRTALMRAGDPTALTEAAFEVFFAARMEVDLYEDATPALAWLSQRFPIVALSNGNADVHRVGVGAHFVASLSARDVGVGKPDARIFHAAAQTLNLSPDQILHVGDDAALDVVGALNAGMQAAWVNRDQKPWEHVQRPHLTVATMQALCEHLGQAPLP